MTLLLTWGMIQMEVDKYQMHIESLQRFYLKIIKHIFAQSTDCFSRR